MELNRLKITGHIDNFTPICVIIEIANSYIIDVQLNEINNNEIYIKDLIKIINRKSPYIVNINNPNSVDLMLIKTFINPTQNWRKSPLLKALQHMISFYDFVEPDPNFEVGNKTEANIYSYNACMLYKLCRFYQINVNRETTKNEMESSIKRVLKGDEIRNSIIDVVKNMSNIELINLSLTKQFTDKIKITHKINNIFEEKKYFCNINPQSITSELLKQTHNILQEPKLTTKRIIPQSQEEVIILTAMVFLTNISESINPHKEFLLLKEDKNNYIPYDKKFRQNYLKNPKWYNIKETWDIKFDCIYNNDFINNFLKNECIFGSVLKENENSDFFTDKLSRTRANKLLNDVRENKTFYQGIYPHIENNITSLYMENIEGYNKDLLITYGSIKENKLNIYTIDELISIFEINKRFVINNEHLTDQTINKLIKICLQNKNNLSIISHFYQKLYNIIYKIKDFYKLLSLNTLSLIELYKTDKKEEFDIIFKETIDLGMAMRGYNDNEYPLTQKQTDITEEYNITGINLTTNALKKFWVVYNNLSKEVKEIYNNLNQYAVINKNKFERTIINGKRIFINNYEFESISNPNSGLTILERIKIIEDKDFSDNSEMCIRTSSNWICGGISYYLLLLDIPLIYDLTKFAYIT